MALSKKDDFIRPGGCYSNGDFGRHWSVRQVVARDGDTVTYTVLAGPGRRSTASCSHEEFVRWARYEVTRNENSWERAKG